MCLRVLQKATVCGRPVRARLSPNSISGSTAMPWHSIHFCFPGIEWVILGHSERRATPASGYGVMANESSDLIAKKVGAFGVC